MTQECSGIALQCRSKSHITLKSVFIDILLDIYVLNHKILGVLCLYSCPIIFLYSDEIPVAIVDSIVDEPLVQSAQEGPDLVIPPPEEIARGRSRPRGQVRETRGKKKGKGAAARRVAAVANTTTYKSYDDPDTGNQLPAFVPCRPPGLYLNVPVIRGSMVRAIDFFKLFFTDILMQQICLVG